MPYDMIPRQDLPSGPVQRAAVEFPSELRRIKGRRPGQADKWIPAVRPKNPVAPPARVSDREVALSRTSRKRRTLRQLVFDLGFSSPEGYFRSPLWRVVLARALDKLGRICVRCEEPAKFLHFARYTAPNLAGKTTRNLHPVCRTCRAESRVRPDGKKTSLVEATRFLLHSPKKNASEAPQAAGEGPRRTGASQPALSRRGAPERRPEPDSVRL